MISVQKPSITTSRVSVLRTVLAVLLVITSMVPRAGKSAQLLLNNGFESGTWSGTYDFVDTNNATQLWTLPQLLPNWATATNSVWVDDPTRATQGGRFVWLDPSYGPQVCVGQKLSYFTSGDSNTQVVGGATYQILADYAFFDPGDVDGSNPMLSSFEIYAIMGDNVFGDDPGSKIDLFLDSNSVSPWENGLGGSGLTWYQASITFTMPVITGYDYVKFYFSAPTDSVSSPSRGVAVDNLSLAAVPEPSGVALLGVTGLWLGFMRRKRFSR